MKRFARCCANHSPPNPSTALSKAYERAQAALDTAKPQIAMVTITVKAPSGVEPTVTIDGQAVPPAVLGGDRPTDPGDHLVEATAQGFLKATTRFNVGPGRKQSIELALERDPDAPVAPPPGAGATGSAASADQPTATGGVASTPPQTDMGAQGSVSAAPNRTAAYVVWAISGAALGVGAGFGFIAMKDKNDLEDKCANNVCSPDQQDKLDSGKRAGNIATIGLGVGAAGAILGTVLFFTAGSSSAKAGPGAFMASRDPGSRRTVALRPRAGVGLGSVQVAMDF